MDFKVEVVTSKGVVPIYIITDLGATAMSFINTKFAKQHKLQMVLLVKRYVLTLADGGSAPDITHMACIHLKLGEHHEEL